MLNKKKKIIFKLKHQNKKSKNKLNLYLHMPNNYLKIINLLIRKGYIRGVYIQIESLITILKYYILLKYNIRRGSFFLLNFKRKFQLYNCIKNTIFYNSYQNISFWCKIWTQINNIKSKLKQYILVKSLKLGYQNPIHSNQKYRKMMFPFLGSMLYKSSARLFTTGRASEILAETFAKEYAKLAFEHAKLGLELGKHNINTGSGAGIPWAHIITGIMVGGSAVTIYSFAESKLIANNEKKQLKTNVCSDNIIQTNIQQSREIAERDAEPKAKESEKSEDWLKIIPQKNSNDQGKGPGDGSDKEKTILEITETAIELFRKGKGKGGLDTFTNIFDFDIYFLNISYEYTLTFSNINISLLYMIILFILEIQRLVHKDIRFIIKCQFILFFNSIKEWHCKETKKVTLNNVLKTLTPKFLGF